jgi:hypothetical protein
MKLTWRDGLATVLFAAIVVPYALYLYWGGLSLITDSAGKTTWGLMDPTGMSGFALVLGIIAAWTGGWIALAEGMLTRYWTLAIGFVSAVLGVVTLVGENLFNNPTAWETMLAGFITSLAVLWGYAILRHTGFAGSGESHASGMTAT